MRGYIDGNFEMTTDNDGWIEHDGGPCPVGSDVLIDIKLRNGSDETGMSRNVNSSWKWVLAVENPLSGYDITHYRLHKPAPDYKALLAMAVVALRPFSDFIGDDNRLPDNMPLTNGSGMARKQVIAEQFRHARDTLAAIEKAVK